MNDAQFIAALEAREQQVSRVRWRAEFERGRLTDGTNLASYVRDSSPVFCRGTIFFDFETSRYRGDFERVTRWVAGAAPFIAHRTAHSFDGSTYRGYDWSKHGTELPTAVGRGLGFSEGYIHSERAALLGSMDFVRRWSFETGIAWMPPWFWTIHDGPRRRLSELILGRQQSGLPFTIGKENDLWILTLQRQGAADAETDVIQIFCDPNRNFAVTHATWANAEPPVVWRRLEIVLMPVAESVWMPSEIADITVLDRPPRVDRCKLSDIELNPTVSEDAFLISFPEGSRVEDSIAGESYIEGPSGTKLPRNCS